MDAPTKLAQHNPIGSDPRFLTGAWTGWFVEPRRGNRWLAMNARLSFRSGEVSGAGRDQLGWFGIIGGYRGRDGWTWFEKRYLGRHAVMYRGWAEFGGGIRGRWRIRGQGGGRFHLWPAEHPPPALARPMAYEAQIDALVYAEL